MQHPILDPLRLSLLEKLASQNVDTIAHLCFVERRKLRAFSQGEYPTFSVEEVERLAVYLELNLVRARSRPSSPYSMTPDSEHRGPLARDPLAASLLDEKMPAGPRM